MRGEPNGETGTTSTYATADHVHKGDELDQKRTTGSSSTALLDGSTDTTEIERLRARRPSTRFEVYIDRKAVDEAHGSRDDSARVRDAEISDRCQSTQPGRSAADGRARR